MLGWVIAFLFNKLNEDKRVGKDFNNIRKHGRLAGKIVVKTNHHNPLLPLSGVKSVELSDTRESC